MTTVTDTMKSHLLTTPVFAIRVLSLSLPPPPPFRISDWLWHNVCGNGSLKIWTNWSLNCQRENDPSWWYKNPARINLYLNQVNVKCKHIAYWHGAPVLCPISICAWMYIQNVSHEIELSGAVNATLLTAPKLFQFMDAVNATEKPATHSSIFECW